MIDFYAPGDGTLRANGRELHIKGANWFGTEGQHAVLYGLEKRSLDDLLAFLAANGFNALRLLFNHEHVDSDPPTPAYDLRGGRNFNPWLNPELLDTTYLEMLQVIVSKAAEHGILVLLACHRIRAFYNDLPGEKSVHSEWPGDWDGLWYDPEWSEARVLKNWAKLSDAFCGAWNVLGADLMNEPHGGGWGRGGAQMDWRLGAQRLGNGVLRSCPRWLMLVEGVGYPGVGAVGDGGPEGMYQWGEDLVGARKYPLKMSNQTKVVYSPHVYGPAIYEKIPEFEPELFKDRNFPRNMPDVWSKHFGFVPQATGQPLLVGETGGTLRGATGSGRRPSSTGTCTTRSRASSGTRSTPTRTTPAASSAPTGRRPRRRSSRCSRGCRRRRSRRSTSSCRRSASSRRRRRRRPRRSRRRRRRRRPRRPSRRQYPRRRRRRRPNRSTRGPTTAAARRRRRRRLDEHFEIISLTDAYNAATQRDASLPPPPPAPPPPHRAAFLGSVSAGQAIPIALVLALLGYILATRRRPDATPAPPDVEKAETLKEKVANVAAAAREEEEGEGGSRRPSRSRRRWWRRWRRWRRRRPSRRRRRRRRRRRCPCSRGGSGGVQRRR